MKRQQISLVAQYQDLIAFVQSYSKAANVKDVASALRALSLAQDFLKGKFLKTDLEAAAFLLDRYCLQKPSPPSEFVEKIALLARQTESLSLQKLR